MNDYMDIKEFVESGYLQEVNRQFLHPLGLALVVSTDENGVRSFSGVFDAREDPEGFTFLDLSDEDSKEKFDFIDGERSKFIATRKKSLGFALGVQPIGSKST